MKLSNGNRCDICGKPRGNSGIDHSACSKARKSKGDFKDKNKTSIYKARASQYLKGEFKVVE